MATLVDLYLPYYRMEDQAIDQEENTKRILAQFKNEEGILVGTPFDLPSDVSKDSLALLCNTLLENVSVVSYVAV